MGIRWIESRTFVGTGALALSAVLLVGCAPGEDVDGVPDKGDVVADAADGGDGGGSSSPDSDESDDEPAEPGPTEPTDVENPEPRAGADCLPGNWFLDNEEFAALLAGAAGGDVSHVQGSVMLSLGADGTATTHYDEWSYAVTLDEGSMTLVRNGTDHATYEVTGDGTMTMAETSVTSTATATMKSGGNEFAMEAPHQPSVFTRATFTCSGDRLTVTADGATTVMYREH